MFLLALLLLVGGYDLVYSGVKGYTLPDGTRTFNPWYPVSEAVGQAPTLGTTGPAPTAGTSAPSPTAARTSGTSGLLARVPPA